MVASFGERLTFDGEGHTNAGRVTLTGGTVRFRGDLANRPGGLVTGRGTLRADGGIINAGTMAFSGATNVVGDVANEVPGLIIVSGGGTTFFDDVTNDGETRISRGSFATFFGAFDGASGTTGEGVAYFEGDLRPGHSSGTLSFGSDVKGMENGWLES